MHINLPRQYDEFCLIYKLNVMFEEYYILFLRLLEIRNYLRNSQNQKIPKYKKLLELDHLLGFL